MAYSGWVRILYEGGTVGVSVFVEMLRQERVDVSYVLTESRRGDDGQVVGAVVTVLNEPIGKGVVARVTRARNRLGARLPHVRTLVVDHDVSLD